MKKNNKKLPRYALGTRNRLPLGYLPNMGIGDTQFSSEKGYDIAPEAKAARTNILPNTLGQMSLSFMYPAQMLLNTATISAQTGASAINNAGGISSLFAKGALPVVGGALNEAGLPTQIGTTAAKSTALNAAGKALGAVGAAYGLFNTGMLFAEAGQHRTAADMDDTLARNTFTTAGGNQYTTFGGPNIGAERLYARTLKTQRQLNFGINQIGTGASIGGLIGGPLGAGIGAAAGLLVGGLGSLFGFGDNEDEVEEEARRLSDSVQMRNTMAQSVAESKDIENKAVNGKKPVWRQGKDTARVSNGELIGNFADGIVTRVPGIKNNKDTNKVHLLSDDFVISNKFGLSDYAANTGDYLGALKLLEYIMGRRNSQGYKNGKLPGLEKGLGTYALATLPHLFGLFTNIGQYNRADNADVYARNTYVDNNEGRWALNNLANMHYDITPYLQDARRSLNLLNWEANRNVGLGIGGRALLKNANYRQYLTSTRDIYDKWNLFYNDKIKALSEASLKLGIQNQGQKINSNIHRHSWLQQANAQKEAYLSLLPKNMYTNLADAAADLLRVNQYNEANDIKNRQLAIWKQEADTERMKALLPQTGIPAAHSVAASPAGVVRFEDLPWYEQNAILSRAAKQYRLIV